MPDLNLIDEGNLEESPTPAAPVPRSSGGGGGSKGVIIVVVLVLVFGGGGFFLYKKGIYPFKKKPAAAAQVQEEQVPNDQPEQNAAQQIQPSDTSAVSLVDTTPIEEKGAAKKDGEMKGNVDAKGKKPDAAAKNEPAPMTSAGKLNDMKGDYTIQVVAFHEQKKAEEIVKNLEEAEYPAFVEKIPIKGGDWYTVRVGRYATAKDARQAVKSFASQLQSNYFIDRVRSK